MVLAKVMAAKADLPSTVAAAMALTQAAAAAVGVLAVARTPEGLLDVPGVELFLVCLSTLAVAVVLALGCLHILVGRSPRLAILGSVASLVISAYWILRRPPADTFPDLAVAYAVLPVLTLGSLAVYRVLAARRARRPTPVLAGDNAPEPADESTPGETKPPWELADEAVAVDSDPYDDEPPYDDETPYDRELSYDRERPYEYEPPVEQTDRPWEEPADESKDAERRDMLVE